MPTLTKRHRSIIKAVLFVLLLLPLVATAVESLSAADPVEYITGETGEIALKLLVATLLITPLKRISGWNALVLYRRMVGLYAFFYALLHFLTYILLDLQLDFSVLWDDIIKRKYITVGFVAFIMLVPLAITSNNAMIKKLGGKKWMRLHKLVYPLSILAAIHFLWQVKGGDIGEPIVFLVIIIALIALRHPKIAATLTRSQPRPPPNP